jgi:outer membrane protein OmpA-like peptidoglycan-associated protein
MEVKTMKRLIIYALLSLVMVCPLVLAADDVLSKYTFVPGEKMIFSEDFSNTSLGEVPASLHGNGEGEIALISNERWLKMGKGLETSLGIKEPVQDLTLEFYQKSSNADACGLEIRLENEALGYFAWIEIGAHQINWGATYKDDPLPGNTNGKEFYSSNQSVQIALTVQKERVKLFVDKKLAFNVAGFDPVMPNKVFIKVDERVENREDGDLLLIKDITLATQVPDIAGEILNKGKYTSHGIRFDTGAANVKDESYSVLKQVADVLSNNPDLKLLIAGHTDNVGAKDANQKLSLARAESVKQYLISKFGVKADLLQTIGKGDTEPIGDNKTPTGRALNRRVEFIKSK